MQKKTPPLKGKKLQRLIEEGSVHNLDTFFLTKSKEKIPVTLNGSVMRDEKGKLIGIICVIRDMREVKKLIDDLEDSKQELREWAETLEEKVEGRTKELEDTHLATLNILEDLKEARDQLDQYSKDLEKMVKERTKSLEEAKKPWN